MRIHPRFLRPIGPSWSARAHPARRADSVLDRLHAESPKAFGLGRFRHERARAFATKKHSWKHYESDQQHEVAPALLARFGSLE
eukprot:9274014-Pyramimonas_sp.AAC.1